MAAITDAAPTSRPQLARATRVATGGARKGSDWRNALFVLPFLLVYLVMLVYPLFDGMWISLHKADLFGPGAFVGTGNFVRLTRDAIFRGAVWNTLVFVVMTVPVFVVLGLSFALALNKPTRASATFRAVFFGTSVLSVTIVTIIWKMVFLPDRGLLTNVLAQLGRPPVPFLTDEHLVLPAMAIVTVWWGIGLPMMLFLAALQQIPGELYEAAALDNASRWRAFRFITLPSIRRTLVLVVIVEIVAQFQLFGQPLLLTKGGPNNASNPIVEFIYERGFRNWDIGLAASASEVLFVLILIPAMAQYVVSRRKMEG